MNKVVFDASALLTLLQHEPGYEQVEKYLPQAIMSAVNISEVIGLLHHTGISEQECSVIIDELINEVIPFDKEHAYLAGLMKLQTKSYGLSLGDRACLALGRIKNLPVFSADKIWSKLDLGIKIHIIR